MGKKRALKIIKELLLHPEYGEWLEAKLFNYLTYHGVPTPESHHTVLAPDDKGKWYAWDDVPRLVPCGHERTWNIDEPPHFMRCLLCGATKREATKKEVAEFWKPAESKQKVGVDLGPGDFTAEGHVSIGEDGKPKFKYANKGVKEVVKDGKVEDVPVGPPIGQPKCDFCEKPAVYTGVRFPRHDTPESGPFNICMDCYKSVPLETRIWGLGSWPNPATFKRQHD